MSAHPARRSLADAYGRYAALITLQLEAIDRGDLDALEPLAQQRDLLADEIDVLRAAGTSDAAELNAAVRSLESCIQADLQLRSRLEKLQAEIVRRSGRADRDRVAIRTYAEAAASGGTIDFSL